MRFDAAARPRIHRQMSRTRIASAAPLQWRASYSTKSQREERDSLDDSIKTTVPEVGVFSNEERGGRFAGGRSKLLPTARGRRSCDTKRWARSRASFFSTARKVLIETFRPVLIYFIDLSILCMFIKVVKYNGPGSRRCIFTTKRGLNHN